MAAAVHAVATHKDIGPAAVKIIADAVPAGALLAGVAAASVQAQTSTAARASGVAPVAALLIGLSAASLTACGSSADQVVQRQQAVFALDLSYAAAAPSRTVPIVRGIVSAKAANQRTVLRRALRDHGERMDVSAREILQNGEARLSHIARHAAAADDVAVLRGYEGEAAAVYFGAFDAMIQGDRAAFHFHVRSRRPPLDRMNALISFLYAMLGHDCRSALEGVGFDPQVGFLHTDRPGRASLALDLMEELRPVLADRLALTLINRGQIKAQDFAIDEGGAVSLKDEGRKAVLIAWQERKKRELRYPFLEETLPLGLVSHVQALLLSRHLRGDLDGYPPFIWK
ncbi:CRISPR-associated endonuclease Cas1 [Acetobacter nitrogenifigens]